MSVEREEIVRKILSTLPEWLQTGQQKHLLTQQRMKVAEMALRLGFVIDDQDQYVPGTKCNCVHKEFLLLNRVWNFVNNSLANLLERRLLILSNVRVLTELGILS